MTHPNVDLIRLKLKEIKQVGLMPTQHGLIDQINDLLDDCPRTLNIAKEYFPNEPK
jgi:hypothetical protein